MRNPFIILLLAVVLLSCGKAEEKPAPPLRPVAYQEVSYDNGLINRTFNGVAQTDRVINLSFRSSGVITQFDIRLGQRVQKGDLLASLDNVQARLSYEQALSALRSAESQMNTAKLNYERIRSLYEKGSTSLSDFENAKNAYQNAESNYESAQRSVGIQKEQINFGYIYAPESGSISAVIGELGENVSPGQAIAVLNAGDKIIIELGLPENIINDVNLGMEVKISFTALPGQTFDGVITELSQALDPQTSTYGAKVTIEGETHLVKAGMSANVTFGFGTGEGAALYVPAKAVGEDSKGRFVFLIKEDGEKTKVVKSHVSIGPIKNNSFEITDGLQEGQKIAVAGLQTLLDGQEVKLQK